MTTTIDGGTKKFTAFRTSAITGQEVGEDGLKLTFTSTTVDTAKDNWASPHVLVYSGNQTVSGSGYKEYAYIRSDLYAVSETDKWNSNMYNASDGYSKENVSEPADWAAWLEANKAGVDCNVHAEYSKDGKSVVITFTNGTSVSKTTMPVTENKEVYISLMPQECTITGYDSTNENASLYYKGWWGAFSEGFTVDKEAGFDLTFHSVTDTDAVENYEAPYLVVYTGDENKVNGKGYLEYGVIRSDLYCWGTNWNSNLEVTNTEYRKKNISVPADWAAWLATNKAGAECTVEAQFNDDKSELIVTFTNADAISETTIPIPEADRENPIYISLTGSDFTLSNIKKVVDTKDVDTKYYVQTKKDSNGTYTIRVIADADFTTADYSEVGFKFTVGEKSQVKTSNTVYQSLKSNGVTTTKDTTKDGAFVVVEITDVPADAAITAQLVGITMDSTTNSADVINNSEAVTINMANIIQ
jgi:hypothetical protein